MELSHGLFWLPILKDASNPQYASITLRNIDALVSTMFVMQKISDHSTSFLGCYVFGNEVQEKAAIRILATHNGLHRTSHH